MNQLILTQRFLKAFNFMQENEGGFSDNKKDPGLATAYGVSSKWFPDVYNQLMAADSPEETMQILQSFYNSEFWNPLYDNMFYEPTAIRLFDLSVNQGKVPAVKLIQHAFNDLSQTKIGEDGHFGDGTLRAVNLSPVSPDNFYQHFLKVAENYYRTLADFPEFGRGWLARLYKPIV